MHCAFDQMYVVVPKDAGRVPHYLSLFEPYVEVKRGFSIKRMKQNGTSIIPFV